MCKLMRMDILCTLMVLGVMGTDMKSQEILFQMDFQDQSLGQLTSLDNDGLTVDPDFAGLSGGWNVIPVAGPDDYRALGVSSFATGGTADNWLISPAVTITGPGAILRWTGTSLSGDDSMLEDYTVLISNTDQEISSFIPITSVIDESSAGTTRELDLNGFQGQTIYFAFNQNGTNDYALTIDDISITLPSSATAAKLLNIVGERYQDVDAPELFLQVVNTGSEVISDMTVTGSINSDEGDNPFSSLNIAPQDTVLIPFADLYPFGPERYFTEASILTINGQDVTSPKVSGTYFMVADPVSRAVFYEDATSATCGWCPEGFLQKELMELAFGDELIVISSHREDPMEDIVYRLGLEGQEDFGGYPSASLNRTVSLPLSESLTYASDELNRVGPFDLEIEQEYDDETRLLSVEISGEAHTTMDGASHRFGMLILENEVSGDTPDFAQANNYSFEAFDVPLLQLNGRDWQSLPDPVSESEMIYDDVVRVVLGGYDGIISSFSEAANGDIVSYQLDYIIPSVFKEENLNLVVFVVDVESGEVVAARKEALELPSATTDLEVKSTLKFFPNPAFEALYWSLDTEPGPVQLKLVDLSGNVIKTDYQDSGEVSGLSRLSLEGLSPGCYALIISTLDQVFAKKLVIME